MNDSNTETAATEGTRLSASRVYQVVRQDGEEELQRTLASLWWSGVASGITISTAVVAEGILHMKLPDTPWRPLVESFGYCLGFVLVVLGRLQLFTESTITAVLPLMAHSSWPNLARTARLWGIVLLANIVGTFVAAVFADVIGFATEKQLAAFHEVSRQLMDKTPWEMFVHSIPAGFYIAAMVWALPNSRGFQIWSIVLATYLIAIGGFAHVIVGSTEAFLLLLAGEIDIAKAALGFFVPVLIGNVLGGTALFSLLAYGQVRQEID